ncbi:MAG: mandelate racemase [Verrucomicrobia bacterium]|nr:mandelate racemase [Verrucomicrobiota bacterium]MBV8377145.1 mandelate racemase [Verrucomicrobiota bacterium]
MNPPADSGALIERIDVSCYTVPTETPESDGTLAWEKTTLVLVEATAGGTIGLGYSYADVATGKLVESLLADVVQGMNAFDVAGAHASMVHKIRNLGRPGIVSMAISAVDNALWDLKAKLLGVSLLNLLGAVHERAIIYGSGGFTSYSMNKLQEQLGNWAREGIKMVKMKIGRDPVADLGRVRSAREAIGPKVDLFVDANGAYSRKQALAQAEQFAEAGVRWFEEPVSSDDLEGLRLLRDRAPAGMNIAAGEYGYNACYFRRMLAAGAVDVLQADATRCGGVSGFLQAAALCQAFELPFSFHCAPALHAALACAVPAFWVGEYFFDHARIEQMFFEGAPQPVDGALVPDRSRLGFGLEFKRADAERFSV